MQSNPTVEPSLSTTECTSTVISDAARNNISQFIGLREYGINNDTHWLKAFERSIADFIPLLPLGGDIKIGVIDYVFKIVGGAVTFGLIAIALRRRLKEDLDIDKILQGKDNLSSPSLIGSSILKNNSKRTCK